MAADLRNRKSSEGYVALLLLFLTVGILFLLAVCSLSVPMGIYAVVSAAIVSFAFAIGFAVSALRQKGRGSRICAVLTLLIPAIFIFLYASP